MNIYQSLYDTLMTSSLAYWAAPLQADIKRKLSPDNHGDFSRWQGVIDSYPDITPSLVDLNSSAIRIGQTEDCDSQTRKQIKTLLQQLIPWRKGPFDIHGTHIDTEWRSDWKWDRVLPHLSELTGRNILDVGCGNGYHCWRMAGAGARMVLGIDPSIMAIMQYKTLRHFAGDHRVYVVPSRLEELPTNLNYFDTVFSMGVLYHRRSPFDHLLELKNSLRPGGELVLETLIIDGGENEVLVPPGRYSQMRNVWFLPSASTLEQWLIRCGFKSVRCVDINQTSIKEQRSTEWMKFDSLPQFLDSEDPNLTIEGLPAPRRGIFIAEKPA